MSSNLARNPMERSQTIPIEFYAPQNLRDFATLGPAVSLSTVKWKERELVNSILLRIYQNYFNRYTNFFQGQYSWTDDELPILCLCRAIADFSPASSSSSAEGFLRVSAGETLAVLQTDLGSGWTYVRRMNAADRNVVAGFVPTTSIREQI